MSAEDRAGAIRTMVREVWGVRTESGDYPKLCALAEDHLDALLQYIAYRDAWGTAAPLIAALS